MRTATLLLAAGCFAAGPLLAQRSGTAGSWIERDLSVLASDQLEGRRTGMPGADSAARYIAGRFRELGLRTVPGLGGWFQEFEVSRAAPSVRGTDLGGRAARNVAAWLPGSDPSLAGQVIVFGAHYDHLGRGGPGSLDADTTGVIHNGADDNASGVAGLLEVARRLVYRAPARSVLFLAFSGEELGLLGSAAWVGASVVPNDSIVAMINFDMIGRLRDDRLVADGAATAVEFKGMLDSLNAAHGFALSAQGGGYGRSDHTSFTVAGRPVLHLFTGTHEDYHRSTDDWDRINVTGISRIAALAADLAQVLGGRRDRLTFVASEPPPPPSEGRSTGYGAYLGSIPDMTGAAEHGVLLSGVRVGSPAERAGLQAGDLLVRIGDHQVPDLQAMTDALRNFRPDDETELEFIRAGERRITRVTFGRRGG